MFSTLFPPVMQMCASCGLVMIRSVLNNPCDLISSRVWDSWVSNSATIRATDYADSYRLEKEIWHAGIQDMTLGFDARDIAPKLGPAACLDSCAPEHTAHFGICFGIMKCCPN